MTQPLVECIANYSEARRPEVVEAIVGAITGVAGVRLLDRHSDLDHNRTVLSFVGEPKTVEEAAFRSIAKAAELIDLDQHTGEHPRIGATDVVPFVPLSGVTMADCVEIARRLGYRVGDELGIPVYLYEEAATRPERQNLENLRRGQYEALKTEMGVNPERDPDFGPRRVGPAGATVIGARQPLIAFNVYLTTEDLSIAKKIAKTVRNSSGGFRYVKALGVLVEGRAQVTMNMTNYHGTPVALVVEAIRREAARYGVAIHHTELVGLIPQGALVDAAVWYLQLDQFEKTQVLESRLYAAESGDETPAGKPRPAAAEKPPSPSAESPQYLIADTFLDSLASGAPAPGGGSAAAYTGAMAAALVAMVARLTIGKKKYAEVEPHMRSILEQAEALRAALAKAVQLDSEAFEAYMTALKLLKDTGELVTWRTQAFQQATLNASQVPLETARKAVAVIELALQVIKEGNTNAITDAGSGAALARAALTSAGWNVKVNCLSLKGHPACETMLAELRQLEARAVDLEAQILQQMHQRGNLPL
jgi:glutamate formiminotransferase / formiminotetrahydrofolate cyclodeaminase